MLVGALRGDTGRAERLVAGIVVLVVATVVACWALLSLGEASDDVALTVTVLGGSAVTLGFALAPIIASATDPLDPRRFALLGLRTAPLAGALVLAGILSVPVAALAAVAVCASVAWGAHGATWAAGITGVVLIVLTCVLFARVCMALTTLFLSERRSRELSGLFIMAILVVVVPVGVFLSSLEWDGAVPTQLYEAVSVLALTPFGAAWAYPGLVASGASAAAGSLLVALATVVALAGAWMLLVRRLLTTTAMPAPARERGGLGWFAVAPGTPGGAVAARSLIYWFGDRRHIVNVIVIPVAAALTVVPLLIAGVPPYLVALIPVPFAALFLGWLPHNDVAYDATAVWMHVASGIRGVSDRIGRLVPVLLIGVPLLALAIPIAIAIHGRWALLPAMVGVCVSLFLTGLGLSSISSVVAPYAVSPPGESPFRQPQRTGASGAIAQGLVMIGAVVLSAPALWYAWLALTSDIEAATVSLWAGVTTGVVVLAVGVAIGSAVFSRRGDRIMEFAESV